MISIEKLDDGKDRLVLNLKPHLAPVKAAVIPLKKNNKKLVDLAKDIKNDLQKLRLGRIIFENTGNIGKSYRKHDEIGTPICITVDFDSLDNKTVTLRNRDTMKQERIHKDQLSEYLKNLVNK